MSPPEKPPHPPLDAATPLPLRPSLRDRLDRHLHRVFPNSTYLGLPRRRFLVLLLLLIPVLLLTTILLATLLPRRSSPAPPALPATARHVGDGTYFHPALGACGRVNTDADFIVAVAWSVFDAQARGTDPNDNAICGRKLRVQRQGAEADGGHTVDVTVVDRCVGCAQGDLDLSPAAFAELAELGEGRVRVEWAWV